MTLVTPASISTDDVAYIDPLAALRENLTDLTPADWPGEGLRRLVEAGVSDLHAVRDGASGRLSMRARHELDIHEVAAIDDPGEAEATINLMKAAAEIDTSGSQESADGQIELPVDNYPYRARVVHLPLFDDGDNIVIRLPQLGKPRTLDALSMTATNRDALDQALAKPHGLIVIAGRTREGKSNTAHSIVCHLRDASRTSYWRHGEERFEFTRSITSVEDPVERVLEGVEQLEVVDNPDMRATFADRMRHLVRSDSDILFIGEIRDSETARAAADMARTGVRVITTIHAGDNLTALRRLIELGGNSPLSVLDVVTAVISQRLVRTLSSHRATRYAGLQAVHDILRMDDTLIDAFIAGQSAARIREVADGFSTGFDHNVRSLIESGRTDQDEAFRAFGRSFA